MPATQAPYGTWTSPISAAQVAAQGLRLGFVSIDGDDIYWLEGRPAEGGRNVLVRRRPDSTITDVTPQEVSVRSRVHEYGGGAYLVVDGIAYYSNFADQRVYRVSVDGGQPEPLTPEGAWFYADYTFDRQRHRLICVREDHTASGSEAINTLVSIPLPDMGVSATVLSPGEVLASGYDFYSTPRLSPDGLRLAWVCWRHPNMPWEGSEVWVADVTPAGALATGKRISGGPHESALQPGWSPDGTLYFISDLDGWWHLYRAREQPELTLTQVTSEPWLAGAEFGRPHWQFGQTTWTFAGPSRIVASYTRNGRWRLLKLNPDTEEAHDLITGLDPGDWLAATPDFALTVAGSMTSPQAVVTIGLDTNHVNVLRSSSSTTVDPGYVSEPKAITFQSEGGVLAHAFYYPPRNSDFVAPSGERPPLIVVSHGGPTTASRAMLDLQVQFWTSRGFAVVDVNYSGSSGYGRAYRERLNGKWGVLDVADCVNAARSLVADGVVDPKRLAIRGGSAGGYTTLAALTFHPDVFTAGASYYGISDIEVLAQDTHKFESRYLDSLMGPYPEQRDVYRARSPIHFVDHLACPLILFQGLEDKVVPPNQAEMMAAAVRAKGLPVALLMFEGEQHGFRRAETIVRSLEAELYFYGKVFGFTPADRIAPVEIANG